MARFVDLEEEEEEPGERPQSDGSLPRHQDVIKHLKRTLSTMDNWGNHTVTNGGVQAQEATQSLPEVKNSITRAFQCYPIVVNIVSYIDINTLDSLARTSRSIHSGLIQFRRTLLAGTLRCSNESLPVDPENVLRFRARAGIYEDTWEMQGRIGGKSGDCARDMVAGCRRCGTVVCRNCAIKPPSPVTLRDRHRRLCKTCVRAPLWRLAVPQLHPDLAWGSDFVKKAICRCAMDGVWLCQPCGRGIRAEDIEYKGIWRWRNQYGEVLGGLGTGIGDGDRGVICGRGSRCLAAKEREHEVDCDAEDAKHGFSTPSPMSTPSHADTPGINQPLGNPLEHLILESSPLHARTPSPQLGPGYERHEIEGIGGVVKRKLLRMVKVGACVPEWDDEHGMGKRSLEGEITGKKRSWCGWCWRVVPRSGDVSESKEKVSR